MVSLRIASNDKAKRFHWVLKNFSSSKDNDYYSCNFVVGGCNWCLRASYKEDRSDYILLRLEVADPASLPLGWSKEVKFRLTLGNKIKKQSNRVLEGHGWFDAIDYGWGFREFSLLDKLHAKGKFIIVAEVQILQAITEAEDTVKISETLSCKERNQTNEGSHDNDACKEDLDGDNASKEGLDDDENGSSHVSDDGGRDTVKITETLSCKGNQATAFDEGAHDNDASQGDLDDDDASKEDLDDDDNDRSSLVSINEGNDEDGTVEENPDDDASSQPANQTVDVNGFQVLTSQVKSVSHIFKRHPDTALSFRPKNQQIRRAYMNELLRLIETLCQSPEKLSDDDLSSADETLVDLIDAGFKLDWLKTKLNEVSEKKKIEKNSVATLQTMEEQLQKLKNMVLDIESQLQKEKAKALAARAPLSFEDVVC